MLRQALRHLAWEGREGGRRRDSQEGGEEAGPSVADSKRANQRGGWTPATFRTADGLQMCQTTTPMLLVVRNTGGGVFSLCSKSTLHT